MNYHETRQLMLEYDIRPTRSLGQNFLIDDRVVRRICDSGNFDQTDMVIEIGPGMGSLTRALSECAGYVTAIEIDRHMLPVLEHVLQDSANSRIVHQDALKSDLAGFCSAWQGKIKVAANLPYYITAQLVEKLLIELPQAQNMLLMMQKEASARLTALPGSKLYGPLAVLVNSYGSIKKLVNVHASSYFPKPKVDSVIMILEKDNDQIILKPEDMPGFARFLHVCFSQRRKVLSGILKKSDYSELVNSGFLSELLIRNNLSSDIRAESLKPQLFIDLYKKITNTDT